MSLDRVCRMEKLLSIISIIICALSLGGCLASTTSPVGINCDFSKEKPLRDMPLDCQGR
ncbi:hypothetical protein [Polynucleobacter sp. MWH-Braz-FAM2G]|uniref:hypothetical protein n=1 Tax=Polynucleobacter sp. MWH-Braz-FAM2G TaxID=1855883 RepID=UPI001BFDFEFA|nr:hypothetical protein [Polynucleobacter sp. MWH-Braz-FAM2G]QWD91962.1 hypothetical protein FD973_10840 [Polynucleobacter sp. MWH-Braz-FAM2G]